MHFIIPLQFNTPHQQFNTYSMPYHFQFLTQVQTPAQIIIPYFFNTPTNSMPYSRAEQTIKYDQIHYPTEQPNVKQNFRKEVKVRRIVSKKKKIIKSKSIQEIRSKPVEKSTKNAFSNLLRTFFRNIVDLKSYDGLIERVILKHGLSLEKQKFYALLMRYDINYKNYIRTKEVQHILSGSDSAEFRLVFRTVLDHYIRNCAALHCIHSKRIEKHSLLFHLTGLHELRQILFTYQ